jgi:hypothetical protein
MFVSTACYAAGAAIATNYDGASPAAEYHAISPSCGNLRRIRNDTRVRGELDQECSWGHQPHDTGVHRATDICPSLHHSSRRPISSVLLPWFRCWVRLGRGGVGCIPLSGTIRNTNMPLLQGNLLQTRHCLSVVRPRVSRWVGFAFGVPWTGRTEQWRPPEPKWKVNWRRPGDARRYPAMATRTIPVIVALLTLAGCDGGRGAPVQRATSNVKSVSFPDAR